MKKNICLLLASLACAVMYAQSPDEISRIVINQFLSSDPQNYCPEGYDGARKLASAENDCVRYPVVSLWVKSLENAELRGDKAQLDELIAKYEPFASGLRTSNDPTHVDFSIYGALPLEIYMHNIDKRALAIGLAYADAQWKKPGADAFPDHGMLDAEGQMNLWREGLSAQSRWWIDDLYMITLLQLNAYKATADKKYLDRAVRTMVAYLPKVQREDGLVCHAPDVPFVWGRGAGWVVAGMTLLLDELKSDSSQRQIIMDAYQKMMSALLRCQRDNGMWGQIVDDSESWDETSGTAMFAYGFASGVRNGYLDRNTYMPAVEKAWKALCSRLDEHGNLADVCIGTNRKNSREWYLDRKRINGDPHGQAPLLWLATELIKDRKANPSSVIVEGNARFTFITSKLVRMEWAEDGKFEDRRSLTFIQRNLPAPDLKVSRTSKFLTVKTNDLTLSYKIGSEFAAGNLKVEFLNAGKKASWTPGADDNGNLMGTTRTLDNADGRILGKIDTLEKGIVSRDGWSLIDDSKNYLFDDNNWVTPRDKKEKYDWYLFAYGHEYRQAMADYSKVAGSAPLPPRYVFGYWWSRYWQYSDSELRDIINRLRSIDIPVDVLIIDMDWHETWGLSNNPKLDEFGQRIGWTGYTWQKELFPKPENMYKWAQKAGLKVALNLHPASGIQPYEEPYERFCKDYGWQEIGKPVPFHIDERKWAESYYSTVLKPFEDMGNTFWWLDWQQWKESKYNPGLSNTFWLNHVFFNYAKDGHPDQRPFLYHRWGGLGSHRYPLGFSGDTIISWESLEYQPEFTATSANVNYGYWGHDMGGHMFHAHKGHTNPERYTRWLQYGVFTPLYKIHPTKHPTIERYPWLFPDYLFQMVEAFHLRYALVPYIYNCARRNFDTGIAMNYPLYYNDSESNESYENRREFMFGDDILATCIATPADSLTGVAKINMWFPKSNDWYDMASGTMYKAGTKVEIGYTIDENPWYAKAGAVIPMNPASVHSLQTPCDTLVLTVIPGADGELSYYEDDGVSQKYSSEYAVTKVRQERSSKFVRLVVEPRRGRYDGMKPTRSLELRFPGTQTPSAVTVNGVEIQYDRFAESGQWTYEAYHLCPIIYLKDVPTDKELVVELSIPEGRDDSELCGLQGLFLRCRALSEPYKNVQGLKDRRIMLPIEYLKVSQCPNFIMEDPQNIWKYVDELKENHIKYKAYLDGETPFITDEFKARLKGQL